MVTKVVPLNEAFDMMLKELNIKASRVCDRSGVSPSRLSQFRSGKGGDIGVRSLDALLIAAQSENSRAMNVFASYLGGIVKSIEDMTLAEKGELMMALGKSIHSNISTDSQFTKTP
jgi:transcriptional regulator with XRE-family HTH domain